MSKLLKAPLIEVVTEIKWKITNKSDYSKIQYLYGDIYSELKNKYPIRESIAPPEIPIELIVNSPAHRYRCSPGGYPLFQVGPGIITLNTIDEKYYWNEYYEDAKELISTFLKVYPFQENDKITAGILFLDFFPFDFENTNAYDFINEKFKIEFRQNFIQNTNNPKDLSLGFFYTTNLGDLSVVFQKGKNNLQTEGIILQTRLNGKPVNVDLNEIMNWINDAHDICSDSFKRLTEGELYSSFK